MDDIQTAKRLLERHDESSDELLVLYFNAWEGASLNLRSLSIFPKSQLFDGSTEHDMDVKPDFVLTANVLLNCLLLDGCAVDEACWLRYRRTITRLSTTMADSDFVAWDLLQTEQKKFLFPAADFCNSKPVLLLMVDRGRNGSVWIRNSLMIFERYKVDTEIFDPITLTECQTNFLRNQLNLMYNDSERIAGEISSFFEAYKAQTWPYLGRRGLLLYGPPGTGKSTLCNLIKKAFPSCPVLFQGVAADLNSRYVGDTEKRIRELLLPAQAQCNKLFFFILEELDTIASSEEQRSHQPDHKKDVLAVLQDAISTNVNVIFLSSTNFLSQLDERMIRPGRFGVSVLVMPPNYISRAKNFFDGDANGLVFGKFPSLTALLKESTPGISADTLQQLRSLFVARTRSLTMAQLVDVVSKFSVYVNNKWMVSSSITGDQMGDAEAMLTFIAESANRSPYTRALARHLLLPLLGETVSKIDKDDLQNPYVALSSVDVNVQLQAACHSYLLELGTVDRDFTNRMTGRVQYFARSGLLEIDRELQDSLQLVLPRSHTVQIAAAVDAMVELWKVDHVIWVTSDLRHTHKQNFEGFLNDLFTQARSLGPKARSMIVLDVDDIIGLVPSSYHRSWQNSASTGTNKSKTNSSSYATSVQDGTTFSLGLGTTWTKSQTYAFGKNWGVNVSKSISKSMADTTSLSETVGHSTSTSAGVSVGQLPSFNFNSTETWSRSVTEGSSHTVSNTNTDTAGYNIAKSKTDTSGKSKSFMTQVTDAVSHQSGETIQKGDATTLGVSNQQSKAETLTMDFTVQYTNALATISQFAKGTNRVYHPSDPFIVLLFRNFEPPFVDELLARAATSNLWVVNQRWQAPPQEN